MMIEAAGAIVITLAIGIGFCLTILVGIGVFD